MKVSSSLGMSRTILLTPWNFPVRVHLLERHHELHPRLGAVLHQRDAPGRVALEADHRVGDRLATEVEDDRVIRLEVDAGGLERVAVAELVVELRPLVRADVEGVVDQLRLIEEVGAAARHRGHLTAGSRAAPAAPGARRRRPAAPGAAAPRGAAACPPKAAPRSARPRQLAGRIVVTATAARPEPRRHQHGHPHPAHEPPRNDRRLSPVDSRDNEAIAAP